MSEYGVALFYTTSSVMRAEKLLVQAGHAVKLIPTPRQFSSDCGIALRFSWEEHQEIKLTLDRARVEFDTIHRL